MAPSRKNWFTFKPDFLLAAAAVLTALSVLASWLMNASESRFVDHLLRQLVQVMVVSTILPFIIIRRYGSFRDAGIRFDRWWLYLAISLGLAVLLTFQMGMDIGFDNFVMPRGHRLEGVFYIMVTNVAEVLFFACFLRYSFERSFGIIPGVILAAAAFSLHHAGFQPEFLKLFLVGLVFISIVRIANHWLVAFPMWWVGGLLDVLFGSDATSAVDWSGFALWAAAILAVIAVMFYFHRKEIVTWPERNRNRTASR